MDNHKDQLNYYQTNKSNNGESKFKLNPNIIGKLPINKTNNKTSINISHMKVDTKTTREYKLPPTLDIFKRKIDNKTINNKVDNKNVIENRVIQLPPKLNIPNRTNIDPRPVINNNTNKLSNNISKNKKQIRPKNTNLPKKVHDGNDKDKKTLAKKLNINPSFSPNKSYNDIKGIVSNLGFKFADVSIAIESSGRRNELRSGTIINDFKKFVNTGKNLTTKAPRVVKDAKHKYALLLGGDCNKNLGDACNRDLIAVWAEILDPVYGIKIENVWITTQITDKIKKIFNGAKLREMTPNNFETTLAELLTVVSRIHNNESVFIYLHYSGHGYQIPNELNYKKGQRDEAILVGPTILATGADIRDNFLAEFSSNVQIFSLWDACHSASIADLPYKWNGRGWENATINEDKRKTINAKIVSISACEDNQVDAQITGKIIGYGGALTIYFYETDQYLKIDNPINVHAKISSSAKKIRQTPILTSSWKFK